MTELQRTARTTAKRRPDRVSYERAALEAILDEGLVCHVGFVADGQPFVIPTVYVRIGDRLCLHGSAVSRMLGSAGAGIPLCVTVTLLDGLVLARSAFKHSVNYRSAVVLGNATEVVVPDEKRHVLATLVDRVAAGRSRDVRAPSEPELKATRVLALPLVEASVKVRTGPPVDDADDYGSACWAGVVPLRLTALAAVADARVAPAAIPPALGRLWPSADVPRA